jgi:hypothetical protein
MGVGLADGDGLVTGALGDAGGLEAGAANDGLPPAATWPGSSDAAADGLVPPTTIARAIPTATAATASGMRTTRFNGRPDGGAGCS